MTVLARVRAPATTANVGPGFDCAAIALDLWNEVVVSDDGGEPDGDHLGVQAFRRLTPAEGLRFEWATPIPRERGLGSSASVIALGLVAACAVAGRASDPEELLAAGLPLEGHGDNLAAALAGGVVLTWGTRIARVADRAPASAIALVPETVVSTAAARASLPGSVAHADAAHTAGRAALLGAALATGSAALFAEALDDRLHEPYRSPGAPLFAAVRSQLPAGALGVTISGSGPTVIVWASDPDAGAVAEQLARDHPEARVLPLAVSSKGAHAT
jgi:homoserine kinase